MLERVQEVASCGKRGKGGEKGLGSLNGEDRIPCRWLVSSNHYLGEVHRL